MTLMVLMMEVAAYSGARKSVWTCTCKRALWCRAMRQPMSSATTRRPGRDEGAGTVLALGLVAGLVLLWWRRRLWAPQCWPGIARRQRPISERSRVPTGPWAGRPARPARPPLWWRAPTGQCSPAAGSPATVGDGRGAGPAPATVALPRPGASAGPGRPPGRRLSRPRSRRRSRRQPAPRCASADGDGVEQPLDEVRRRHRRVVVGLARSAAAATRPWRPSWPRRSRPARPGPRPVRRPAAAAPGAGWTSSGRRSSGPAGRRC